MQAAEDVIAEREEALANALAAQRRKKSRLVDPLQYAMSINAAELVNYKPEFGWASQDPTQDQRERLEKLGIRADEVKSRGEADLFLDKLAERKMGNLATPRQIKQLEMRGFQNVGTWSFDQARVLIDRIAANGWRTPRDINPRSYEPQAVPAASGWW